MSPENNANNRILGDLPSVLDEESRYLSGGFHHLEAYQTILGYGEAALPELLDSNSTLSAPRMQLVIDIANEIGKPIEFEDGIKQNYDEVNRKVIQWSIENGYREPPTE